MFDIREAAPATGPGPDPDRVPLERLEADQAVQPEPARLRYRAIEPQDWMPSLRREYTTA